MAKKNKDEYNEYMRDYMKRRYLTRRQAAIISLGGVCVDCGATELLEFDHSNPREKKHSINFAGMAEKKLQEELQKCVLRCHGCHLEKSRIDNSYEARMGY